MAVWQERGKRYSFATTYYLAKGKEGFDSLRSAPRLVPPEHMLSLQQCIRMYLERRFDSSGLEPAEFPRDLDFEANKHRFVPLRPAVEGRCRVVTADNP